MALPKRAVRRTQSRHELTGVAIDCFARYGYQATSIDRIARAAGVTKGALYYHFKDKEELLFEAVRNRVGQFERRVARDVTEERDPVAALRHAAGACFEHATKSNHRRFIVTLMVEALDTNARLSAHFREMMQRFRQFVADIVRRGQEAGVFRRDVDRDLAAGIYAAAIMGAEVQYYQDPKSVDLRGIIEAFVDHYVAWLRAGAGGTARRRDAPVPARRRTHG